MRPSRRQVIAATGASCAIGAALTGCRQDPEARARTPVSTEDRALVMIYFAGGNDSLSFLSPYQDPHLYARRPTQFVPPERVLELGADGRGVPLGLHPNLQGIHQIYESGHAALIQRVGYENASRSHFLGADIWESATPARPQGTGWLGRYFESMPYPVDPLVSWNTQFQVPRAMSSDTVRVASIVDPAAYSYYDPWGEAEAARLIASYAAADHLAYLNETASMAMDTIGRVSTVTSYEPTVVYPATGLGSALQLVSSAIAGKVGTKVFWVQTGGYDTHATQGTIDGIYASLMTTADAAISAFYQDLSNQGLLENTLILQYSEFGRRIDENGSQGTDHGAAGTMMAIGGSVRGGIYGSAARSLESAPDNPDLENEGRDLRPETDFREVYASVIDNWLGGDSVSVLGANYRNRRLNFV